MAKGITDNLSWTTIGWQKITLQVPADWNLAGIGGDARSGYLRIDGPDRPRVEIKWWDKTHEKTVNVAQTVATYLKDLQKKARKQRIDLTVEEEVKLLSKRHKGKSSLQGFAWRGDVQAYGVIWYCPQCSRVTMAQVSGDLQENLRPLAVEILSTLEDHSREGWDVWSAFGLFCHIPADFELQGQQLVTGLTQLHFARRQSLIRVSRYGLADVVLKEALMAQSRQGRENRRGAEAGEGAKGTEGEETPSAAPHPGGPLGPLLESVGGRVMEWVDRFKRPAPPPDREPPPRPSLAGYLGQWCLYQRRKEWRGFRVTPEETEWRGHAAVLLRGTQTRWVDRARNAFYRLLRAPYPFVLEACAWHCSDTNQIFMVEHLRGEREESLWEPLREGTRCHLEGRDR
jgi:hypothetical protein